MSKRSTAFHALLAALPVCAVLVLAGCSKDKEVAESAPPPPPPPAEAPAASTPPPAETTPPPAEPSLQEQLRDVFYDYDSSTLSAEAQGTLDANGKLLMDNASVNVQIEGHCDERGTVEYNLALGERRARAAYDYLASLGVDAARMKSVSYGKEIPICQQSNEDCWARNRRDHFAVTGKVR